MHQVVLLLVSIIILWGSVAQADDPTWPFETNGNTLTVFFREKTPLNFEIQKQSEISGASLHVVGYGQQFIKIVRPVQGYLLVQYIDPAKAQQLEGKPHASVLQSLNNEAYAKQLVLHVTSRLVNANAIKDGITTYGLDRTYPEWRNSQDAGDILNFIESIGNQDLTLHDQIMVEWMRDGTLSLVKRDAESGSLTQFVDHMGRNFLSQKIWDIWFSDKRVSPDLDDIFNHGVLFLAEDHPFGTQ